jgi:hypothetical protein
LVFLNATQSLPDSYQEAGTLDLSKNPRLLVILNLAGVVILLLSGWLFFLAILWIRPQGSLSGIRFFSIGSPLDILTTIIWILALTAFILVLHEAIHGLFFWLFTRSVPRFAFKGVYAYAAAPGWYLSRNPFVVTTLAPLIFISLGGLLVFRLVPAAWLFGAWFALIMNASGAVGDILVTWWILRRSPRSYVQDRGDSVTLYLPKNE